ncbi:MAG TPA: 23S rRNA (uracil(1939)-C(5))-methyltransferase RlmD [Gallionella sp.]|jgi:23S rRNA (uracil1939-C5)-methyltransferase|nr:23S rRNA (uracil(1939)-C(5))-methyltransferase RlmD [Gallionella sp.]OGS67350.1 MAG: 23S rRNA (uracil(1939)-C(5))-methyltransferase [Gallionellales bacterium GWA2_54_124]OGT19444.1 MAG: 23S rRNA (uracil(1939)-C(5))-methyltransferase [Gallionellales bacterium RIFOXYD12_FULL_53_10]OGT44204.1 MAG: 23S rRNA (uracil(1939)-C(5))-methyltransferase [Gallionellales bacterium RIFOXYD2_FULL_52_7]HCI52164.1 23S rRNA (uracil(1939)-C(5))-methyltransferase RlmD [Gallionella sp.]
MTTDNRVTIESLDQEGRGIAHAEGKVIFIEGALTGEVVSYASYRKKPSFELAQMTALHRAASIRVEPKCKHYGMCGGCSMQHLDSRVQVAVKQRILEDSLSRIGKVKPESILPAIYGQAWGYRERARISAKYVIKKEKMLVGFHEKRSSFVADMQSCEILEPKVASLIQPLANLLAGLSIRDKLPQIEVAVGENVYVLVLRIMAPLSSEDEAALRAFADQHSVQFWLQTKGPETVVPFYPLDAPELTYSLPEFGVVMPFAPGEFTQVNSQLNRVMISRAIRLLDPQKGERIVDFFCGLGNFTLPIARSGAQVTGIEGSDALVKRAAQNAASNTLSANTAFSARNLFEMDEAALAALGRFDKWLIDPPRDGAMELVKSITPEIAPDLIVYVSCNPATLARDAAELVLRGYVLKSAGVMNMFPQTSHVESIAVFVRS